MSLATVEAALQTMLAHVRPLDSEAVPVAEADGRWLVEDVWATRDQPPFDASSMDGWAVKTIDTSPEAILEIVGESAAGRPFHGTVEAGQAVRISTGAPLPAGSDRVVIQEEVTREGDKIRLGPGPLSPVRIRDRGCDYRSGDRLLAAGQRIDPWQLALAASAGMATLCCTRRPVVAVLTTGDELVQPGRPAGPGQIHDAAGPALAAVVSRHGGIARRLPNVGDQDAAITKAVGAEPFDLLVTIGGASVGDHDRVKPALKAIGAVIHLEGVAMRPGRPVWFALLADGRPVLGLPGNPASALVCAQLFLAPLLARMQGANPANRFVTGVLTVPLPANGPRDHYLRARAEVRDDGRPHVTPFADQDSSLIGVMAQADVLVRREPLAPAVPRGAEVEVLSPQF